MNLYQCQEAARELSYDNSTFTAIFPVGPVKCKWLDAYMGLLQIDMDGLRDGFITFREINESFPNLVCTEPIAAE